MDCAKRRRFHTRLHQSRPWDRLPASRAPNQIARCSAANHREAVWTGVAFWIVPNTLADPLQPDLSEAFRREFGDIARTPSPNPLQSRTPAVIRLATLMLHARTSAG